MKNRIFALLSVLLLPANIASAAASDEDMLGFYFDASAETNCLESSAFVTIPLHLVLTNPAMDALYGYEFGYTATGSYMISGTTLSGAIDMGGSQGNHIVGLSSPLSSNGTTVLATLLVLLLDNKQIRIDLHGATPASLPDNPELPVLLLANDTMINPSLSTSAGSANARINGICNPETVEGSWDGVKVLYQ
jgi:hypothetical protein